MSTQEAAGAAAPKKENKPDLKIVKNLYQKLAEIKKSVSYLQKTKPTNDAKYAYVSSSDVLLAIREAMETQGLLLIPTLKSHGYSELVRKEGTSTTILTELAIQYTWVDIDNPDSTLIIDWYGQGVDISGEKGVGKALTYAEKYFFLKFFNIPTDKDDPDVIENKSNGKDKAKTPTKTTTAAATETAATEFCNYQQKEEFKKLVEPKEYADIMNKNSGKLPIQEYERVVNNG